MPLFGPPDDERCAGLGDQHDPEVGRDAAPAGGLQEAPGGGPGT